MSDLIFAFLAIAICIIAPIALTSAITAAVVRGRYRKNAPSDDSNTGQEALDRLSIVEQTIRDWVVADRLDQATADLITQLIVADRASEALGSTGIDVPATSATEPVPAPAISDLSGAVAPRPMSLPDIPPPPPPLGATPAFAVAMPEGGAAIAVPTAAPQTGHSLGAALLSLGTRRTLLFLGSFLLIVSSLVLVVFNWASFPPIIQLMLLAGVAGGIWAGGTWMTTREELVVAGKNLQAIGALLAPIVVFAAGRPGLLDLSPRASWLMTSIAALALYSFGAVRTSRRFYSFAASISAISSVLAAAAVFRLPLDIQPALCIVAATVMLVLAQQLRAAGRTAIAMGPFWIGHATLAGSLFAAAVIIVNVLNPLLAISLVLGAIAYGLQAFLRNDPRWLWPVVPLLLGSVQFGAMAANFSLLAIASSQLSLSAVAFALTIIADQRKPDWSMQPLALTFLAYLATLANATTPLTMTVTYPFLIAIGAGCIFLLTTGRLRIVSINRDAVATIILGLSTILSNIWVLAICNQFNRSDLVMGFALLTLAVLFLALAHSRVGKQSRSFEIVLRLAGAAVSLFGAVLSDVTLSYAVVTLIWCGEAWLRRDLIWSSVGVGALSFTGYRLFEQLNFTSDGAMLSLGIGFIAVYAIGAAFLQGRNQRHWMLAGNLWAIVITPLVLGYVALRVMFNGDSEPLDIAVIGAFTALSAGLSYLWRKAWFGYPAAITFSVAVFLAGAEDFFINWNGPEALLAYTLIGLSFALALTGTALRRIQRRYALPYEIIAAVLLPLAPVFAFGGRSSLTIVYGLMALLYALAVMRYRANWPIAPALITLDLGLLNGAAWLLPGGSPSGAAWILAAAATMQALGALLIAQTARTRLATGGRLHGYAAAAIGALGALAFVLTSGDRGALAGICALFAVALAVIATFEQQEPVSWAGFVFLTGSLVATHTWLNLSMPWNAAWLLLEQLALVLIGWALQHRGVLPIWHRATRLGPLALSGAALVFLAAVAPINPDQNLPALTFGLVGAALILASLAVRERAVGYAYAAGGAIVGAALCQLAVWGFRNPQAYVIPAGLYLLVLGNGLRRMHFPQPAQLIEAGALTLMLGVTAGQALRNDNLFGQLLILCTESLAVVGYGTLMRLRVPFVGGLGFFIFGVSWMGLNAARFTNQWVLLGIVGLLMVAAYVLLERHQERLVRAGNLWITRLRSWS